MKELMEKLANAALTGAKDKKAIAAKPLSTSPRSGHSVKEDVLEEPKDKYKAVNKNAKHPGVHKNDKAEKPGKSKNSTKLDADGDFDGDEHAQLMAAATGGSQKVTLGQHAKKVLKETGPKLGKGQRGASEY